MDTKNTLWLMLFLGGLFSCNRQDFKLSGSFDCDNGWVILSKLETTGPMAVDSFEIADGTFHYEAESLVTGDYSITFPGGYNSSLILENGDLEVSFTSQENYPKWLTAKVSGSENNDMKAEYEKISEDLLTAYPRYKEWLDKIQQEGADRHQLDQLYEKDIEEYRKAQTDRQYDFLIDHSDKYFVTGQLPYITQNLDLERRIALYDSLTDELKETPYAMDEKEEIDWVLARQPGKKAPDFSLMQTDSTLLTLSDLQGQYVMLDFWASWCGPCRASFPHMKELYAKYHPLGFEILGVSNDSRWSNWTKAIEEDQIPWKNVIDEFPKEGRRRTARVITLYAFSWLPSTLLIDPDGFVVGSYEGEELDQKLQEVFQ